MALSKEAKQRDRKAFVITLIVTAAFILLGIITSGFWKVVFFILAGLGIIFTLIFLFASLHLKDVERQERPVVVNNKKKKKERPASTYTPQRTATPSNDYEEVVYLNEYSEFSKLSKEEKKGWNIYKKAQQGGYKNYQQYHSPLAWKKHIWDKLNYYEKKGYVDVTKGQMKFQDKKKWEEDHPILTGTKKAINYIVNLEFIPTGSSSSGTIRKKDSIQQAAKDIKRMLNSSASYSDGTNGTCKYQIRDVYVSKYNEIIVDVRIVSISLGEYGTDFGLKGNLRSEIYDTVISESGGYPLKVDI